MARVALLEGEKLAPGESMLAQLVADHPLGTLNGDRFIVRDAEARHTLGGGTVLDPDAPARKRKTPLRLAELAALKTRDPASASRACSTSAGWTCKRAVLEPRRSSPATCRPTRARQRRPRGLGVLGALGSLKDKLRADLAASTNAFPTRRDRKPRAPAACSFPLPAPVFAALAEALLPTAPCSAAAPGCTCRRIPSRSVAKTKRSGSASAPGLPRPRSTRPGCATWPSGQGATSPRCTACCRSWRDRASSTRSCATCSSAEPSAQLAACAGPGAHASGETRAAEFRDKSGLGRKRAIQMLEFFDRVGYTRRVREAHRLRNADMFGSAAQSV
jgi:selenocysteine-specific elongation factor